MNIDWMTFKIEWKSKSAKIKRLLLDLLENDSHYNHVEYLDPHSKYSCVPVVDAMRLYRKIQLMSIKYDKEKKKNEQ